MRIFAEGIAVDADDPNDPDRTTDSIATWDEDEDPATDDPWLVCRRAEGLPDEIWDEFVEACGATTRGKEQ